MKVFLDFFEGDEGGLFMVDPFAAGFGFVPVGGCFDTVGPPGEGATLLGSSGVDFAKLFIFEKFNMLQNFSSTSKKKSMKTVMPTGNTF